VRAIRVVLLNNEILPYRIPLFAALARLPDLEVHVVYCSRRDRDREWDLDDRQLTFPHSVLPGVAMRLPKKNYQEWRTIWINPTLFFHLRSLRPDVVVGYEYSVPSLTSLFYAGRSGCPYVVWTEGTPHSERDLTWGQRSTRRLIIPRARAYVGTSHVASRNLVRLGAPPDRVFVVPQTHPVEGFEAEVERARARRQTVSPVVLFVGFLNERKGVLPLLRAFPRVLRQVPNARLRLIGSGGLRAQLESEAGALGILPKVDFVGFVQPTHMPEEFANADVFVLPSLEDTFGVVVAEALAGGVPVVCSKFAGVSSHLADGQDSFVVDPLEPGTLADRISILLTQRETHHAFAERGRKLADIFRPEQVALQFRQALRAARPAVE
jgi:glycosyltransferase involved in cell wall biosynthesis